MTSTLVTGFRKENIPLAKVPCTYYPVQLWKNPNSTQTLLDSRSKVNTINPAYAKKLGLWIRKTELGAQKIDGSSLDTFGMVITSFQVQDILEKFRFFQETFLVADTRMNIVLGIPFLTLSNIDIRFAERELTWKIYTAVDTLPTTKRVQIINRKKVVKVALDPNKEVFVVHVATITSKMAIYLARQAQIASLKAEEAFVTVPKEYSDYTNIFSEKLAAVLPEHTEINTNAIDLEKGKQPPNGPIYSLRPMKLKILKTFIETNLANSFIHPFKSLAGAPILFARKPNWSLRLCVNYQNLNNLTIKNQYPFLLISESLDWLEYAKQFI